MYIFSKTILVFLETRVIWWGVRSGSKPVLALLFVYPEPSSNPGFQLFQLLFLLLLILYNYATQLSKYSKFVSISHHVPIWSFKFMWHDMILWAPWSCRAMPQQVTEIPKGPEPQSQRIGWLGLGICFAECFAGLMLELYTLELERTR